MTATGASTMEVPAAETRPAHGGRLIAARWRYPAAPWPFLDLSTGINPCAWPVPELPAYAHARLPEPEAVAALEQAAASAYGVAAAAMVVAAPGTQILIGLLPLLFPQGCATILAPTYAEHAAAWADSGAAVRAVDALPETPGPGALVLCNPNNPDGRRFAPAALQRAADALMRRGGVLVVDESFADFTPGDSLAAALPHPAMIVLRSFGKAYGLPGLRLGFALAAPERAARLRRVLGPWPVSGAAIAIGIAALADTAWRDASVQACAATAAWLDAQLQAAGLRVLGGTALFRLAAHDRAAQIAEHLGQAGILVRRFAERPSWLRFGLPGTPADRTRLAQALATLAPGCSDGFYSTGAQPSA